MIALGIAIVNLGLFLPDGFLLPLVRPFQLRSPFRTLLLAYFPALGGMVLLMLYTFRAPREPQPPLPCT